MVNKSISYFLYKETPKLNMAPKNLIEVSFEVSNKVGGIYQVLKSKTYKMKEYYGENYLAVGFYNEESARKDFAPREENPYTNIFEDLEKEYGIKCHYGVWTIENTPKTILVDPSNLEKPVEEIKTELWEKYGIDTLNAGYDVDEPLKWSYSVGKLIEKLEKQQTGQTVAHLHEWLSGPAMFYNETPSVFTTHATVLGRAMSDQNFDLNNIIQEKRKITDQKAEQLGVKAKHQIEKQSAKNAQAFTTVSENTGKEAEIILQQKPDVILPNGFNTEEYPSLEDLSYNHTRKKKEMKEFLRAYFKPYYDLNLRDDPRILFISGRYEFHNKGIDLFLESLAELNEKQGEDFFVFIFVPADVKRAKLEVLENMSLYQELEDYTESIMPKLKTEILSSITSGENPSKNIEEIIKEKKVLESLQTNFRAKKGKKPPLSAYDLNYDNDAILDKLEELGLQNKESDRAKVIFYPTYLSVGDKLLSMSYNDAIVASSAGIFPSYYEPWGYTPVETAANGALAITTDLAGFGQYILENTKEQERKGINVLERKNQNDGEAREDLAKMIEDIIGYSKTEITEHKHNARKLAQLTSWEKLGENYQEAHKRAVNNN